MTEKILLIRHAQSALAPILELFRPLLPWQHHRPLSQSS